MLLKYCGKADKFNQTNTPLNEQNISARAINIFSAVAIMLVGGVYFYITNNIAIAAVTTIIMIVMAFFFAVASYIVGLVGNSNSPVSGMTITAVLLLVVCFISLGFWYRGDGSYAWCSCHGICAACTSGDVCNDLKTGQIVGATPYRQQTMQIAGVAVASLVMAPIMQLLHENTQEIGGKNCSTSSRLVASLAKAF